MSQNSASHAIRRRPVDPLAKDSGASAGKLKRRAFRPRRSSLALSQ